MRKIVFIAAALWLAQAGNALAVQCERILAYVKEAEHKVIAAYERGDTLALEREMDNLMFWDANAQMACDDTKAAATPLRWMSRNSTGPVTQYKAGYLLWLRELRRRGIDLTPGGIARGRTFK